MNRPQLSLKSHPVTSVEGLMDVAYLVENISTESYGILSLLVLEQDGTAVSGE